MYLRELMLSNVASIDLFNLTMPFHENGNPKPLILVGENGSGKSVILSFIVNSLISAKQEIYENTEVEQRKVYKYRSPSYIRSGEHYYFGKLIFEENFESIEWQLDTTKKMFEETYKVTPIFHEWKDIPENETSLFKPNFRNNKNKLEELQNSNVSLYFPPNRFEEPAWLNIDNLLAKANFTDSKNLKGYTERRIIAHTVLQNIINWLLDVTYDSRVLESKTQAVPIKDDNGNAQLLNLFLGYQGANTTLFQTINNFLKLLLSVKEPVRFGVGVKQNRKVSILKSEQTWIPNIFNLSTGQTSLLSLYCSILRDYDLTGNPVTSTNDIRGIVLVDEIDSHLHTNLQKTVLPQLLKSFPKVQFIITSHSPLFLIGMNECYGESGVEVREVPSGRLISPETFREFGAAYQVFRETKTFQEDLLSEIEKMRKPIIYTEGEYDVKYISKAAEFFNKEELLSKIDLRDGGGAGNLTKIWKYFNNKLAEILPQKIMLLFDCDTNKTNEIKHQLFKRIMPTQNQNPVKIGIENLFPEETITKAIAHKSAFIDITGETTKLVRGEEHNLPRIYEVNKDEKGNLCDWLCENGQNEDFVNFADLFEIIEEIIQ